MSSRCSSLLRRLLCTAALIAVAVPAADLTLTAENTVILNGAGQQGRLLQYYLIKGYVGDAAAAPYHWTAKDAKPAASPHFPLVAAKAAAQLPADKHVLAVGNTSHLTADERAWLKAKPEAILFRRSGNVIVLGGKNAARRFLNEIAGVRLYAPEDLWLSRPQGGKLVIRTLDHRFEPQLSLQPATGYEPRFKEWRTVNMPVYMTLYAPHNVSNYFKPETYGESHPEIYEQRNGKRVVPTVVKGSQIMWHPCFSAAALPELAMRGIRAEMKARPTRPWISLFVMDSGMHCECTACADTIATTGDLSQAYHAFVIKVATICKAEFPNLLIMATPNYGSVKRPPVGLRYPGNVVLNFNLKSFAFVNPAFLAGRQAMIREYSDLGARWRGHDWNFGGVSPRAYTRQYATFLQWAAQNGIIGVRVEWSAGENWYLDGARYWVMMQLYWNPYQDVNALWRTYCRDMYGAGAEAMYRFYQHFADKYVFATDYISLSDLPRQEPGMFTAEDLAYQRRLLDDATARTRDDARVQARLDVVRRYFIAHELFSRACAEPIALARAHEGDGINRAVLAYYANEEGNALADAIAYFQTKRTIPPDAPGVETRLGLLPSHITNYTTPKADLIQQIRRAALAKVDVSAPREKTVAEVVATCKAVFRAHLPARYREDRVAEFDTAFEKLLWVPRGDALPTFDGDLSDGAWANAASLTGFSEADTGIDSAHRTHGKIMRVGDQLVIGLVCTQAGPVWANTPADVETGTNIWRESGFEFFFGDPKQGEKDPSYAQYIVNALGAFRGFRNAADSRDGVLRAVALDAERQTFTMEVALPLKAKDYDYTRAKVLSFNALRNVYLANSYQAEKLVGWHPVFYSGGYYRSRGFIFME
jgi:hypothetical protein